jgi:tetratricopeptide (TPR) repeat protein
MAAGDYTDALALAMQAGDKARTREAFWALVSLPDAELLHIVELADGLRTEGDCEGLLRLADLSFGQDMELARAMRDEVLRRKEAPLAARLRALEGLASAPDLATRLNTMLPGVDALPLELAEQLLVHVRALPPPARIEALGRAADGWPARSRPLLRERYELERAEGQDESASRTLSRLIDTEQDSGNRAALLLERGELLLTVLDRPVEARGCLERAVEDDPALLAAVRYLLGLYDETRDAAAFSAMAEHLETVAGAEALEPYRERLADAYEVQGELAQAAAQLEALEETPERLARRARLAEERGLVGEALQLRERLSDEPAMLESILRGYLEVQLVALAARLAERLLDAGVLSAEVTRLVAERLAPTPEGAALAARIWPGLLRDNPTEVDGWTLYAEALRRLGRAELAVRMDGFGAALASSDASTGLPTVSAVPAPTDFHHPAPPGALPVTAEQLPRLHAALRPVLQELGAGGVRLLLDPAGGVEAYLTGPDALVLGAGGLGCFGQAELGYLCALALCLGGSGEALARPGPVSGFEAAAVRAFRAVPSSLAAGRVLARLESDVRGADPAGVDVGAVLARSATFRTLALAALDDAEGSHTTH